MQRVFWVGIGLAVFLNGEVDAGSKWKCRRVTAALGKLGQATQTAESLAAKFLKSTGTENEVVPNSPKFLAFQRRLEPEFEERFLNKRLGPLSYQVWEQTDTAQLTLGRIHPTSGTSKVIQISIVQFHEPRPQDIQLIHSGLTVRKTPPKLAFEALEFKVSEKVLYWKRLRLEPWLMEVFGTSLNEAWLKSSELWIYSPLSKSSFNYGRLTELYSPTLD